MSRSSSLGGNYRKLFVASTISNLGDGISLIAYPWLASAITRNPLLIALVAVVQRLPWLVFTLPAGVITDRSDRRLLMSGANAVRFVLTAFVAGAVFVRRDALPAPDAVEQVAGTETLLYLLLLGATLLLGVCEVLHDNSAQTFMPSLVADEHLERANGRLYSAELVANQFVGPPLAGLLLAVGFALPFVVDAGTFAASAVLVFSIAVTRQTGARRCRHAAAVAGGDRRGVPVALAPPGAAHDGHLARRAQPVEQRQLRRVRDLRPGGPRHVDDGVRHPCCGSGDRRCGRRLGGALGHQAPRHGILVAPRRLGRGAGDACRRLRVVLARRGRAARAGDVLRRGLERDHRQLPAVGDPRSPARQGQQRLPLLRVGGDPDRRARSAG